MKTMIWFKRSLAGVLSAGTTLLLAACYGATDMSMLPVADGRVTHDGVGVPDLQVCVHAAGVAECTVTDYDGNFAVGSYDPYFEGQARDKGYGVCVQDADGEAYGLLQSRCVQIPAGNVPGFVYLEVDDEPLSD
jgi:hypothetical protein